MNITDITLRLPDREPVKIYYPEGEYDRLKRIFMENEYRLPDARSHKGTEIVLDIGANVGMYSLYHMMINPDSEIHAFEPVKDTFYVLHKNLRHYNGRVHTYCYGLYDTDKHVDITTYRNSGMSSFKLQWEQKVGNVEAWVKNAGKVVDDLELEHIDVIKIDTEGCEVEILTSLGKRLQSVDYIMCEYHSESDRRAIDGLLEDFTLIDVVNIALLQETQIGVVKYMRTDFLQEVKP